MLGLAAWRSYSLLTRSRAYQLIDYWGGHCQPAGRAGLPSLRRTRSEHRTHKHVCATDLPRARRGQPASAHNPPAPAAAAPRELRCCHVSGRLHVLHVLHVLRCSGCKARSTTGAGIACTRTAGLTLSPAALSLPLPPCMQALNRQRHPSLPVRAEASDAVASPAATAPATPAPNSSPADTELDLDLPSPRTPFVWTKHWYPLVGGRKVLPPAEHGCGQGATPPLARPPRPAPLARRPPHLPASPPYADGGRLFGPAPPHPADRAGVRPGGVARRGRRVAVLP